MKKTILLLILIATNSLLAQENNEQNLTSHFLMVYLILIIQNIPHQIQLILHYPALVPFMKLILIIN